MALNLRIRALREERNLTLKTVAGRANMTIPHLSQIERGIRRLNNDLIARIAQALDVDPNDLIGDEPPDDLARLEHIHSQLSPEDRVRLEAFGLALLQSQPGPPRR